MKTKSIYTLITAEINDAKVGGSKLIYKKVSYPVKTIQLKPFSINLPLLLYRKKTGGFGIDIVTEIVVYYNPYKKLWDTKRKRLPYHQWGKPNKTLTNLWLEMEYDWTDICKSTPLFKTLIEDHVLIKLLRNQTAKFILYN